MIHQGFNADIEGKRVFDGVLPHVSGGGLMWLNHRFACGVSAAGQQYEDHENIADRFPFPTRIHHHHITGKRDAILKRPRAIRSCCIHRHSAGTGNATVRSYIRTRKATIAGQPDTVRVFLWSSSQHFADPNQMTPSRGVCQQNGNIVKTSMFFRGMLDAMDAWATGTSPPDNRIPKRSDSTLLTAEEWHKQFPSLPGVNRQRAMVCRLMISGPMRIWFPDQTTAGDWGTAIRSWCRRSTRTATISRASAPMVQAPLGTPLGWNLRDRGQGKGYVRVYGITCRCPGPTASAIDRRPGARLLSVIATAVAMQKRLWLRQNNSWPIA